jgi:hypothetical protein
MADLAWTSDGRTSNRYELLQNAPVNTKEASKGWISNEDQCQADLDANLSSWRVPCSKWRLKPSIFRPWWKSTANGPKLGQMIDQGSGILLLKFQTQRPRLTPPTAESSKGVVPSWIAETLGNSSLKKYTSKWRETLQEYRLGYENPVGEVSSPDLKQISLDLSFTESQDIPYGSKTSQSVDKYMMMITL